MIAKASLSSLTGAQPTRDITGFSSSLSMGIEVEWTHVDVQRWRSRTYEFWIASDSMEAFSTLLC